jgi:hypothetical protein
MIKKLLTNMGIGKEKVEPKTQSLNFSKGDNPGVLTSSISLKKQTARIVLEKKKLSGVTARVGLVLDISGSMRKLYKEGVVQEAVERVLAVASQFDDDGAMDVWIYDNEYSRLPAVTEKELAGYIERSVLNNPKIHKFGRNDEPKVMEDVINKYTKEDQEETPAFVIFLNDGGCKPGIKKFVVESSTQPIFWQFVGIGDGNFDTLRKLDTMGGRVVDNANFFHLQALEKITDEDLYDQLLDEFPMWLKEAKEKRIIR